MKVEILGGPRDGEVLEVRDGTHEICFPVNIKRAWETYPAAHAFETIVLPILKRVDGKFIVKWKKGY